MFISDLKLLLFFQQLFNTLGFLYLKEGLTNVSGNLVEFLGDANRWFEQESLGEFYSTTGIFFQELCGGFGSSLSSAGLFFFSVDPFSGGTFTF